LIECSLQSSEAHIEARQFLGFSISKVRCPRCAKKRYGREGVKIGKK